MSSGNLRIRLLLNDKRSYRADAPRLVIGGALGVPTHFVVPTAYSPKTHACRDWCFRRETSGRLDVGAGALGPGSSSSPAFAVDGPCLCGDLLLTFPWSYRRLHGRATLCSHFTLKEKNKHKFYDRTYWISFDALI